MAVEAGEHFPCLPVFNLKMWVERREHENGGKYEIVLQEFYEKQMVTPRVISKENVERKFVAVGIRWLGFMFHTELYVYLWCLID